MVASRESAVRACPCPNSPSSAAWNRPEPASSRRCRRDRARAVAPSQQRDAGLALADLGQVGNPARPGRRPRSTARRAPRPGVSTRAISGIARSMSNQCMAWPARTASTLASGSGISSALPGTERTSGIAAPQLRQHLAGPVPPRSRRRRGRPAPRSACRFPRRCRPPADRPAVPDRLQRPADRGLGIVGTVLRVGGRGGAERRAVPQPVLPPRPGPGSLGPWPLSGQDSIPSGRSRERAYPAACLAS